MLANLAFLTGLLAAAPAAEATTPDAYAIEVVDEQTGRGVPLVELKTVHGVRLYTDSQGIAAFDEPGLMDQKVFFHVRSHGYEFPADGFGYRGKVLDVRPGGSARLTVRRLNVAERLYRVTGAGIYRDSVLVGRPAPIRRPLLNAQVFGSDSVVNAVYRGKIRWFWGDTNRPGYPLGLFHVPGAVSSLPGDGGLDPSVGVDLEYETGEDGFARAMAKMPGEGPTWIDGLVVLPDASSRERLYAAYAKIRNMLEVYERGLLVWDDDAQRFEKLDTFDGLPPVHPAGHPFRHTVDSVDYFYFPTPYPLTRVRAEAESLRRLDRYETFTCLKPGSRLNDPQIDRDANGTPRYAWKADTPALPPAEAAKLVQSGVLKPDEALINLQDAESSRPVQAHGSSVYWNAYRRRWGMIALEAFGEPSFLGEIWFAEADSPLGPWIYARRVVTHDKYSFYNPKQHPFFAQDDGRVIYFEGTYTNMFSGNPDVTPLYDYNQVMYRLDLSDPRLNLPVPIYREPSESGGPGTLAARGVNDDADAPRSFDFCALERPGAGTIPVAWVQVEDGGWALRPVAGEPRPGQEIAFHALPADAPQPPATTVPLVEFTADDGKSRRYATEPARPGAGSDSRSPTAGRPICRVWKNPTHINLPRD